MELSIVFALLIGGATIGVAVVSPFMFLFIGQKKSAPIGRLNVYNCGEDGVYLFASLNQDPASLIDGQIVEMKVSEVAFLPQE